MSSIMELSSEEVGRALRNGDLTIGILGLGWMGLPTACLFTEAGAKVIGGDVNPEVIELIKRGRSPINEQGLQALIAKHIGKGLSVTTNVRQLAAKSDVILIIVPTTLDNMRRPDYSAIERACKEVGLAMRRGCMIIIESTVGPGVTEMIVRQVLEANSGLKAAVDFGLAYSPIRAMAGKVMKDVQTYIKIIGGIDERSLEIGAAIFAKIAKGGVLKVRDLKTAEAVKLFENIYRDVNIALAIELAMFCEKNDLDFIEVREAAITQPYCHLHIPRVGVGGHCIPFNPYFLIAEADSIGIDLRLIKYARKLNEKTPAHIINLVIKGLKECKKRLRGSRIAVLGLSYRDNVKEAYNSPSLEIIQMLIKKGAKVNVYDPFFSAAEIKKLGFHAVESIERAVGDVDCILIATGHEQFKHLRMNDVVRLVNSPACIIDGWRIFDARDVRAKNLVYYGIGIG